MDNLSLPDTLSAGRLIPIWTDTQEYMYIYNVGYSIGHTAIPLRSSGARRRLTGCGTIHFTQKGTLNVFWKSRLMATYRYD